MISTTCVGPVGPATVREDRRGAAENSQMPRPVTPRDGVFAGSVSSTPLCVRCAKPAIRHGKSGRPRKYCSATCRHATHNQRRRDHVPSLRSALRRETRYCKECKRGFTPYFREQKCCSMKCGQALSARLMPEINRRYRNPKQRCEWCSVMFWRAARSEDRSPKRIFCSREHAFAFAAQRRLEHARTAWRPRLRIRALKPCVACRAWTWSGKRCKPCATMHVQYGLLGKPLIPRTCRECGNVFTPRYRDKRRGFCSDRCDDALNYRVARGIRRARLRGVTHERINPREIFARDGWRCQLCGTRVHRRRKAPHPLAPSLDHIVPLSLGGTHTRANVQLAHVGCNTRKGIAKCGSQLRITG
jgi:hypothetical protein